MAEKKTPSSRNMKFRHSMALFAVFAVCVFLSFGQVMRMDKATSNSSYKYTDGIENNIVARSMEQVIAKSNDNEKEEGKEQTAKTPIKPLSSDTKHNITDNKKTNIKDGLNATVSSKGEQEDKMQSCFSANSKKWLESPRLGNSNSERFTPEFAKQMILDLPSLLNSTTTSGLIPLKQSLCYESSRFVNDAEHETDEKSVRLWATRLIYLAIHYHQHRLAIPEARVRFEKTSASGSCDSELTTQHGVGAMDYECHQPDGNDDTKYLIMRLTGNGLGANIRGGVDNAFIMGLATDRVVLFHNKWALASCPREDYQCFFLPSSPCTLSLEDTKNATNLGKISKQFQNTGRLPAKFDDEKVVEYSTPGWPLGVAPQQATDRIVSYIEDALLPAVPANDSRLPVLRQATELIREGEDIAYMLQHALSIYFLRPNPEFGQKLDAILEEITPPGFQSERALLGLPIRASDKCNWESECLSFQEHMQIASYAWQQHQIKIKNTTTALNSNLVSNPNNTTVIFTTESKDMVRQQQEFASNATLQASFLPLQFDFISNTKDMNPDSGKLRETVHKTKEFDEDDAMLASLASLKFQMLSTLTIGNCCSNFHRLLQDLLEEGCGAAHDNTFMCMQKHPDPALKVCCGWNHACKAEKKAHLEQIALNASKLGMAQ